MSAMPIIITMLTISDGTVISKITFKNMSIKALAMKKPPVPKQIWCFLIHIASLVITYSISIGRNNYNIYQIGWIIDKE